MKQEINFTFNMAVEFLSAVYRYVNQDKVDEYNFDKNEEIITWLDEIDENISPFLENDLEVVKKADGILWPLIKKSIREKIRERGFKKAVKEYSNKQRVRDMLKKISEVL